MYVCKHDIFTTTMNTYKKVNSYLVVATVVEQNVTIDYSLWTIIILYTQYNSVKQIILCVCINAILTRIHFIFFESSENHTYIK